MKKIDVYTDGGSRNNPGLAGIGFVVIDATLNVIYEEGKTIGVATNNVAEYSALIESIKWLLKNKNTFPVLGQIVFHSDSELLVNQMTGKYKVKDMKLKNLVTEAHVLLGKIKIPYSFIAIPREKNKLADKLVNEALDGIL